jgi:hypothetical protein
MARVLNLVKATAFIVLVFSIPVTMGSCIYRVSQVPPDPMCAFWGNCFKQPPDPASTKIFFESVGLLAGELFLVGWISTWEERKEAKEKHKAFLEWQRNHIHDWDGCICKDPKCIANRHDIDENCKCTRCGEYHHGITTDTSWDFGSSRVVEQTCTRCGQVASSYGYYAG